MKVTIEDTYSFYYRKSDGYAMPCLVLRSKRGKINTKDIYEALESAGCDYTNQPFIQVHMVQEEAPASMYDDGDCIELFRVEDFYNDYEAQRNVPIEWKNFGGGSYKCPICENTLSHVDDYCSNCGQRIKRD